MDAITESLLENSRSAITGCIELHNKPNFAYRYEVCTILAINGWELMLKAYINENCPEIKLIKKDTSKPFLDCLSIVTSTIGNSFRATEENLRALYDYRCHIVHFYKDKLDVIVYSLLHMTILFYNDFSKTYFNIDLSETSNLILLPIGFKPFVSPIDYLSNKSDIKKSSLFVQNFIERIITSTNKLKDEGIEDAVFLGFNMAVINENRIKNADIIAAITKDPVESKLSVTRILEGSVVTDEQDAINVRIEEESLFRSKYKLSYSVLVDRCKELYSDFKQNPKFNRIMREVKANPDYHRERFLDIFNKTGQGRSYYSMGAFNELDKHYTKK